MTFRIASILVLFLAGCMTTRGGDHGGPPVFDGDAGSGPPAIPGVETLGHMCFGACGAADSRKCSLTSPDCASDLCLVDPGSDLINYCTVDCTSRDCPAGWRCEEIQAFGHPEVTRACVAEPAACGDGVTQLGETCDGDDPDPAHGRCVDCTHWEALCDDGVVQAGEACDGDTADGYCGGACTRVVRPSFSFRVNDRVVNAVDREVGSTTYFYGVGHSFDSIETEMGDLPRAGDADGCGAMRVVEATAELTRLEWTHCNEDRTALAVFTFAIPRTMVTYDDWDGPIPPEYAATVTLRMIGSDRHVDWTMSDMQRFVVRNWQADDPAHTRGNIQFRLEHPDAIQSFTTDPATLDLEVEMTHPVLP